MLIDKNIAIEDLVREHPFTVRYLSEKGIKCIACGEPIWGTLEEAAHEKGFSEDRINSIVLEINEIILKAD
ncbi:MAG: hypothetical protein KDC05_12780 [Bacteroidales bacterium]|nr:hypothetical protein [Bacteroidales bacterium]